MKARAHARRAVLTVSSAGFAKDKHSRADAATVKARQHFFGSVASALFPHTVLSYQNAAGVRYTPPRRVNSDFYRREREEDDD